MNSMPFVVICEKAGYRTSTEIWETKIFMNDCVDGFMRKATLNCNFVYRETLIWGYQGVHIGHILWCPHCPLLPMSSTLILDILTPLSDFFVELKGLAVSQSFSPISFFKQLVRLSAHKGVGLDGAMLVCHWNCKNLWGVATMTWLCISVVQLMNDAAGFDQNINNAQKIKFLYPNLTKLQMWAVY